DFALTDRFETFDGSELVGFGSVLTQFELSRHRFDRKAEAAGTDGLSPELGVVPDGGKGLNRRVFEALDELADSGDVVFGR
ncbi:hypothetical protein, partial [Pseudomonas sp. GW101-1A09]|uniref:hypothetical protein n=1 Tax=Pseudomonas sp. GW101-1A09 TaxID=2070588 RepID=UPI000CB96CA9